MSEEEIDESKDTKKKTKKVVKKKVKKKAADGESGGSEAESSYERRRRERAEKRKGGGTGSGSAVEEDSIERRRREREERRKKRELDGAALESGMAAASSSSAARDEDDGESARAARERKERRAKELEKLTEETERLKGNNKEKKTGKSKKFDDSDDSGNEDDYNPNLAVTNDDDSSDNEPSEESKLKAKQKEKLDRAKDVTNVFTRMDAGNQEVFTMQGAAVINALAGGKTKDLTRFMTKDEDEDDIEEEKEAGKPYMVNPMVFGGEDRSDQYGAIFGKDLEWFPVCLRVWRMERFIPKPVPVHLLGKFLTRETYLVLSIDDNEDGSKNVVISYWLGSETTIDKSGGAAFRIGELSGYLSAMARVNEISMKMRQERFEEGEESDDFRNLFDAVDTEYLGFHVEQGGTQSEFNKVDADMGPPSLYRVAADGHTHEMGLEEEALNRKHAFLLDEGKVIWVWHGANATYFDRFKAVELASKLANKERMGRARVVQIEDDEGERKNPTAEFWKHFGLVRPPFDIKDEFIAYHTPKYRIWRTQNVDGKFDLVELTERPFAKSMLQSKHCVIFDAFFTIYCWKGTRSSPLERAASELLAQKFLTETAERPKWARMRHVLESAEPELFKEKFGDWKDAVVEDNNPHHVADAAPPPTIDVQTLLEEAYWEPNMLDDGSGSIEAWVITGKGPKFEKLAEKERGTFWSGSCYMVLYSYTAKDEDGDPVQRYRVYFWQGARAGEQWYPQFMFGFFPVLERRIKGQGRQVDQVHIHQGSEPKHFAVLFGSLMIIRNGERKEPSAADESPRLWEKKSVLFDVRLQMPSETVRAIEPEKISAAFLHSEGTFVLVHEGKTYIWIGKASRLFPSAEGMKSLLLKVGRGSTTQMMEGDEEDDWWKAIGGPGPYCKKDRRSQWVPRLFEGYALDGQLKMREIVNYSQWDLSEQQSYLLDCYDKLYVWYGSQCSETMKQSSILVANTYIRLAATVREMYVGLEMFASGSEPLEFTWVFHTWMRKAMSSARKVNETRELRLRRLQLLEYKRLQLEEGKARRQRIAAKFVNENKLIVAHNKKIRENDDEIERHNSRLAKNREEDAKFEKEKQDRERARKEKEEAFKKEMEEMEKERERKRIEREERRKAEEAAEAEAAEEREKAKARKAAGLAEEEKKEEGNEEEKAQDTKEEDKAEETAEEPKEEEKAEAKDEEKAEEPKEEEPKEEEKAEEPKEEEAKEEEKAEEPKEEEPKEEEAKEEEKAEEPKEEEKKEEEKPEEPKEEPKEEEKAEESKEEEEKKEETEEPKKEDAE